MAFTATAQGRYFKVYRDGVYVSQHLTEREALERAATEAEFNPTALVKYVHEYEVVVSSLTRSQSVVFQAAGAAAGAAAGGSVGENAALDAWGTAPNLSVTWGQAQDFSFASIKPQIAGRVESIAGTALPTGFTLDDSLDLIRYGQGGVYGTDPGATPRVTTGHILRSLPTALADWNARTGAAGVLWASRFQSAADIQKWPGQAVYDATYQQYGTFQPNQGIIPGDGCFRQTMFAGSGNPARNPVWGRPIQPFLGDINQPGLTPLQVQTTSPNTTNIWNNGVGAGNTIPGYIINAAYDGPHGSPSRTPGYVVGREVYLQFRVRFSTGRILNAGASAGKMVMFETNYNSPVQELVLRAKSSYANVQLYTSQSSWLNSVLATTQRGTGPSLSDDPQPGATNYPSCLNSNPGACFQWAENVWYTVYIRFRPGLNAVDINQLPGASVNAPARNTIVQMSVAAPGQPYQVIHDKSDYVWFYDNGALNRVAGSPHAYGINWINFNYFTGGGDWVTQGIDWYHEFDQVICSLQPIACPAV